MSGIYKPTNTMISIKDILKSDVDPTTGSITGTNGRVTGNSEVHNNFELWNAPGIISIPTPFTTNADCAQGFFYNDGANDICIAVSDKRTQKLAGNYQPGDTILYSGGTDGKGQARILAKSDGGVSLYTTKGNAVGATGLGVFVDAQNDTITITNSVGNGIQATPDGVFIMIQGAKCGASFNSDGSVSLVATTQMQVDGASIVIGSMAVPGVNSAIIGISGITGIASLKTVIQ